MSRIGLRFGVSGLFARWTRGAGLSAPCLAPLGLSPQRFPHPGIINVDHHAPSNEVFNHAVERPRCKVPCMHFRWRERGARTLL